MADSKFYGRGWLADPKASWVERLLALFFRREDIPSRFDPDSLYMRRFALWNPPRGWGRRRYLHVFYRSDEDPDPHDHPWKFETRVLRGGYDDETWGYSEAGPGVHRLWWENMPAGARASRPATHIHRVRLHDPTRRTWTLVTIGEKERDWFFHTAEGPVLASIYLGRPAGRKGLR